MLSSREAIKMKRNGRMYEMQPIYMNATTCRMFLPTWLKINKSFKNKYELDFTNSSYENEVQIDLQEESS